MHRHKQHCRQNQDRSPGEGDHAVPPQGFNSAAEERKGPATVRERLRGEQSELNWLMRTSYIAHDAPGKAKQRDASALSNGAADDAGSRQELLDDIEVHLNTWRLPSFRALCAGSLSSGMA